MAQRPPSRSHPGLPGRAYSIKPKVASRNANGNDAEADEHLERLRADGELFDQLMWQGFAGPEWEDFRGVLVEYAHPVVRAWIRSGKIVRECAAIGSRCMRLTPRARSADASFDLATDTVAHALGYFRDEVLAKGKWDRTKGAGLRTFFIGACKLVFPNVYRTWLRLERRMFVAAPAQGELAELDVPNKHPDGDPERTVVTRIRLREVFEGVDEATRIAVVLDADGASYQEIADQLHTTRKAVDSRLGRFRSRYR